METQSLQLWPGGASYTVRGDLYDKIGRRLKGTPGVVGSQGKGNRWRKGSAEEWRKIEIEHLARIYADRDILCCDSSLVDDLIKGANEAHGDLAEGFSYEELRNLYADPSDWDVEQCHEYANDHGLELPSGVRQTTCHHCDLDIEGLIDGSGDGSWRDRGNNARCNDGKHAHGPDPADQESDEEDWLKEAIEACQEHTQDNPAEVFEWWRVTSWLCDKLHAIGEVTIDNGYGHWWGRTCTGQGYLMDGTLQRVAAQFLKD